MVRKCQDSPSSTLVRLPSPPAVAALSAARSKHVAPVLVRSAKQIQSAELSAIAEIQHPDRHQPAPSIASSHWCCSLPSCSRRLHVQHSRPTSPAPASQVEQSGSYCSIGQYAAVAPSTCTVFRWLATVHSSALALGTGRRSYVYLRQGCCISDYRSCNQPKYY